MVSNYGKEKKYHISPVESVGMSLADKGDPAGGRQSSALYPPPFYPLRKVRRSFLEETLYTDRQCSLSLLFRDVASIGENCNTYSNF